MIRIRISTMLRAALASMQMQALAGVITLAAVMGASVPARAQSGASIADHVRRAPDGTVRLTFQARPDVCGSGNSIHVSDRNSGNSANSTADVEWDADCGHGPVRLVLQVHDHTVTGIRTYVGGRWRATSAVTDLGDVSPQDATSYLLTLARDAPAAVGHKAIFPATLGAGVVVWPSLMGIARASAVPTETRRDAVFWLGQMAGQAVTSNLAQLTTEDTVDRAVRASAVFALSQQPDHQGVPALIHVAETNRDPAIRKKALFWLGQSNDPRAIALFETILSGPASPRTR